MDLQSFDELASRCAPMVAVATIREVARVESAYNPNALSINYPKKTAAKAGVPLGYAHLSRQPSSRDEAISWARWFIANGHSVSIGLVQVSSQHLAEFSTSLENAFDPCVNLKIGGALLHRKYQAAVNRWGHGQQALSEAFSTYNSGSTSLGFDNGYVSAVRGAKSKTPPISYKPPQESEAKNAPTSVPWNR